MNIIPINEYLLNLKDFEERNKKLSLNVTIEDSVEKLEEELQELECEFYPILDNESSKWIIETECCQLGGCPTEGLSCDSEKSAFYYCILLIKLGVKGSIKGLCKECGDEYRESCI